MFRSVLYVFKVNSLEFNDKTLYKTCALNTELMRESRKSAEGFQRFEILQLHSCLLQFTVFLVFGLHNSSEYVKYLEQLDCLSVATVVLIL